MPILALLAHFPCFHLLWPMMDISTNWKEALARNQMAHRLHSWIKGGYSEEGLSAAFARMALKPLKVY